ncbi:MAG: hypothetical protein ACQESE_00055 [Nanobdellota archaeon]
MTKPKKSSNVNHETKEIVAPLSQGFFLASIIGFLIAVMFLSKYSLPWSIVLGVVSAVMFLASMISMTKAPVEDELALDEHVSGRKDRVVVLSKKEYDALKKVEEESIAKTKKSSSPKTSSSKKRKGKRS